MKNLANCKPSEFLKQTNKIRKSVSKWLTDTDVVNIRARMPKLDDNASEEQTQEAMRKQARENLSDIFDAILDKHPEETLEILALLCFVEPKDVDNHEVTEYLDSLSELIGNRSVLDFFTSLTRLANTDF